MVDHSARSSVKWSGGSTAERNPKLRHPQVAAMVAEAIEHRQRRADWDVFEHVLMPTHLHLFCEVGARGLKETLEEFKRWTGHRAAAILGESGDASGSENGSIIGPARTSRTRRSPNISAKTR